MESDNGGAGGSADDRRDAEQQQHDRRRPRQQHAVGSLHDHGRRGSPTPATSTLGQRHRPGDPQRPDAGRVRHGGGAETGRSSSRAAGAARIRERPDHDHRGEQRTVDRRHECVRRRRRRADQQQRADRALDDHGPLYLYDGATVSTSTKIDRQRQRLTVTGSMELDQFNADGGAQPYGRRDADQQRHDRRRRRRQQQHVGGRH